MLRVSSIAFILRAGVKTSFPGSSPTSPPTSSTKPRYRTIQARIDTILYQRLQLAERDLFSKLQRLIFRSAGCLHREHVYPVGLVLWQLLRFLCISASHLSNIARRPQKSIPSKAQQSPPSSSRECEQAADSQTHCLNLLLSTHLALFRSSNPLLLSVEEKHNQDLLGSDKELLGFGTQMKKVIVGMRDKGFPELKGSITFRKQYFDLFRLVYAGK